jgi:hypothetical protein
MVRRFIAVQMLARIEEVVELWCCVDWYAMIYLNAMEGE